MQPEKARHLLQDDQWSASCLSLDPKESLLLGCPPCCQNINEYCESLSLLRHDTILLLSLPTLVFRFTSINFYYGHTGSISLHKDHPYKSIRWKQERLTILPSLSLLPLHSPTTTNANYFLLLLGLLLLLAICIKNCPSFVHFLIHFRLWMIYFPPYIIL